MLFGWVFLRPPSSQRDVYRGWWQNEKRLLFRSNPMTALICVGMIAGAYGVRGEVRVKSYCANPSDIEHYVPLICTDGHSKKGSSS